MSKCKLKCQSAEQKYKFTIQARLKVKARVEWSKYELVTTYSSFALSSTAQKHDFLTAFKKPDLDIQKILFPIQCFDGITLKLNNRQTDRRGIVRARICRKFPNLRKEKTENLVSSASLKESVLLSIFSRLHATLKFTMSVGLSVRNHFTFL